VSPAVARRSPAPQADFILGHGANRITVAIIAHDSRRSVHMTTLFRPPKKLTQTSIRAPVPRASKCGASSVTIVPPVQKAHKD
jgi:hypothetical protein